MPKKSSTVSSRRHWSSISEQSSDETPTGLTKTVHRVGLATDDRGFELMEQLVGKLRAAGHGTRALTKQEIANIDAYVLSLDGVDAAKVIHPGITPLRFVEGTVALFALALLAIGGLWIRSRASSPARRGPTLPQEFQALRHEVADLKHKLEERETRNPKESSGSIDSQP